VTVTVTAERTVGQSVRPELAIGLPCGRAYVAVAVSAGLVDEYRLFVYPVVQGRGRRLSPKGSTSLG